MGTDHADGVASLPVLANGESNDGGAISGEVVLSAGLQGGGPRVALLGCNGSVVVCHEMVAFSHNEIAKRITRNSL